MRRSVLGMLALLTLLLTAGCGGAARVGDAPRTRADLITHEELQQRGQFSNLYDLVEVLRPRWLRPQGPDTFQGAQGRVQVHMDGNRMGDVGVLRGLSVGGVTSLQWVAPIAAAARYGLDHGHGAIIISTRPAH